MKNELFLDGHKLLYHLDRVQDWLEDKDIAPIHAEISPTSLCNQRCRFCYRDFDGHKALMLKSEVLLNLIQSLAKTGVKSVLLAGDGEPLLNPATPEAIILGKKIGLDMALNTNGVLLKTEIALKILPHLTWLRFSLMSNKPRHFSQLHGVPAQQLEIVLKNIKECVKIKKRYNLSVTLGIQQVLLKENAKDVYAEAKLSRQLGVDYYVLKPFSKHPKNIYGVDEDLHIRYQAHLKRAEKLTTDKFQVIIRWNTFADKGAREYDRCLGIPFIVQIAADGKVYSCCPFFGMPRFSFGNLYKSSFEQILKGARRKKVIKDILQNVDVHKECMTYCRHHQINKFLWNLKNVPQHVNFI